MKECIANSKNDRGTKDTKEGKATTNWDTRRLQGTFSESKYLCEPTWLNRRTREKDVEALKVELNISKDQANQSFSRNWPQQHGRRIDQNKTKMSSVSRVRYIKNKTRTFSLTSTSSFHCKALTRNILCGMRSGLSYDSQTEAEDAPCC